MSYNLLPSIMPWTCPNCNRTFSRNKQWHSCEKHELGNLFIDKPEKIRQLYDVLIERIEVFGPMEIHVAKWNVTLRAKSTFMSIIPEKKDLAITFLRDEALDDFPVYDVYHYSKNRWVNHVKIEDPEEIDDQLIKWLKEAYDLYTD